MNEYIFTFGCGGSKKNKFFAVKTDDMMEARNKMFSLFGDKWAFMYCPPNARKDAGVDRFKLTEIFEEEK